MKKLLFVLLFCSLTVSSFALGAGDFFIKNSRFWQNQFYAEFLKTDFLAADLSFDIIEHKQVKNHIYAFRVPLMFKVYMFDFTLLPFLYPDIHNEASAYGGSFKVSLPLREDTISDIYSSGYLKFSYANQKANITRLTTAKENFKQTVFEGGLSINYANLYKFDISGNIFSYPDGVKDIAAFGGIMNQREVAELGTIDYIISNFPRFSAGGGVTWVSAENNTKTTFSYKYIDFEQKLKTHSLMIQTNIPMGEKLILGLVYNHLFETHKTNRDLFGLGLNYLF